MIQITIDGGAETHDKYRCFKNGTPSFGLLLNVINNVIGPRLEDSKISFILRINLNNNELSEIEHTLSLIKNEFRKSISIFFRAVYNTENYIERNSNNPNEYEEYIKMAIRMGYQTMKSQYFCRSCEACSDENFFYLNPDLSVWKCINSTSEQKGKIGHIDTTGLLKINGDKVLKWYQAANCFSDPKCIECALLPDCLGGCILHKVVQGKRLCSPFDLVSLPHIYG